MYGDSEQVALANDWLMQECALGATLQRRRTPKGDCAWIMRIPRVDGEFWGFSTCQALVIDTFTMLQRVADLPEPAAFCAVEAA